MKVTTEGCLFGALIRLSGNEERILDIGCGTGLLSLMLAQRTQAHVDGIEIDAPAAAQARDNFLKSPWPGRLHVFPQAIQELQRKGHYDLLVSNPPFFAGSKKAGKLKDVAVHNDYLSPQDLISAFVRLMTPQGKCWVLYPPYEFEQFMLLSKDRGLYLNERIGIRHKRNYPVFRTMGCFSRSPLPLMDSEVVIKDDHEEYQAAVAEALAPFYLSKSQLELLKLRE